MPEGFMQELTLPQLEAMTDPEIEEVIAIAKRKINKALRDLEGQGREAARAQRDVVKFVMATEWWELRPVGLSRDEIDVLQFWADSSPENMIERKFWGLITEDEWARAEERAGTGRRYMFVNGRRKF